MSDLQLALIALGAVFVGRAWRATTCCRSARARRRAEAAFRGGHAGRAARSRGAAPRARSWASCRSSRRQDPSLGSLDAVIEPRTAPERAAPAAAASPAAVISEPHRHHRARPRRRARHARAGRAAPRRAASPTPPRCTSRAWSTSSGCRSRTRRGTRWRELRAGLQLASRAGPVAEEEIAALQRDGGRIRGLDQRGVAAREPGRGRGALARAGPLLRRGRHRGRGEPRRPRGRHLRARRA